MSKRTRFWIMASTLLFSLSVLGGCGAGENAPETTEDSAFSKEEETMQTQQTEQEMNEIRQDVDFTNPYELVDYMTVGWNLGNTLDAHGTRGMQSETYWGNPKTTKEMIDAVKAQGFNTLRVPVTWFEHIGAGPDYTIDAEWMERVAEVVNYGLENDMVVILNTHHEPDKWLIPTEEKEEEVTAQLKTIWTQIATYFQDYDERLVFEGMNEPRVKGSANEWNGGTRAERVVVNHLNAAFVEAVRATGGKNENRVLILCTYGNSVTSQTINELRIPEGDGHLAVAVHLYTPYFFTYTPDSGNISEWTGKLTSDIQSNFQLCKTYQAMYKVPFIVTEFGAVHEIYTNAEGERVDNGEQVLKWLEDYMEIAGKYNMRCIWWDNNLYNSNGENFGLFERKTLSWFNQEIADKLVELADSKYQKD